MEPSSTMHTSEEKPFGQRSTPPAPTLASGLLAGFPLGYELIAGRFKCPIKDAHAAIKLAQYIADLQPGLTVRVEIVMSNGVREPYHTATASYAAQVLDAKDLI